MGERKRIKTVGSPAGPQASGLIRIHPRDLPPKDRAELRRQAVEINHTALQIHDIFVDRGYAMNLEALRKSIARERRKARLAPRKPGRPRKTPGIVVKAAVAAEVDGAAMTAVIGVFRGRAPEVHEAVRTFFAEAGLAGRVTSL